jgi:hypothetical protein
MLAQRYPTAYDGIAASAPAINTPRFFSQAAWAQVLMSLHDLSPPACEFDAFRTAAIAECDPLDGIVDGLVSDDENCHFDAFSIVNRTIYCPDTERNHTISNAMAELVDSIWRGPETKDGRSFWYGPNSQARLEGSNQPNGVLSQLAYAMTSCSKNGTCTRVPSELGEDWLRLFSEKNSTWDYTEISSVDEYLALAHASVQQYDSIVGTNDPDLSAFRDAGGKILSYHGMVRTLPLAENEHTKLTLHYRPMVSFPQRAPSTTTPRLPKSRLTFTTTSASSRFQALRIALVETEGSRRPPGRLWWTGSRRDMLPTRLISASSLRWMERTKRGSCALTLRKLFCCPTALTRALPPRTRALSSGHGELYVGEAARIVVGRPQATMVVDLRAACELSIHEVGTEYSRGCEIVGIILDDHKIYRVGEQPCGGSSRRMYTRQMCQGFKHLLHS